MQHILFKNINNLNINIEQKYFEILKNGFSIFNVGNITKNQFIDFCYNFGEVIPSGRGKSLCDDIFINDGTGTEKLPLHTDKSYWRIPPRFEILYVNDVYNMLYGEITCVNLLEAFNKLPDEDKNFLLNLESQYNAPTNRDSGFNKSAKLVNIIDDKIEFFRFRLDIFNSNNPSLDRWEKILEKSIKMIPYKKGDILILDNWKYAAGRNITKWGPNGYRHLFRTLII